MSTGRNRRSAEGFTLIELLIAISLSAAVLIAVMMTVASLLRSHLDTTMKGNVSGWTILALDQMNTEIGSASYISYPGTGGQSDYLSGCVNFSRWDYDNVPGSDGRLLRSSASNGDVVAFYYCKAADATFGAGAIPIPGLLRYSKRGQALVCPADIPAPATCGQTVAGANREVVVRNFHCRDIDDGSDATACLSPKIFLNRGDAIELHFAVGNSTAAAATAGKPSVPVPISMKVDTAVRMANRALSGN